MSMEFQCAGCTVQQAAQLLKQQPQVTILCHQRPDGDTIGSGFALALALRALGKQVRLRCPDPIPARYDVVTGCYQPPAGGADGFVAAVDVADPSLLGSLEAEYCSRVDLCIDHHPSNKYYAKNLLLRGNSASCSEIVFDVVKALGVPLTPPIADALYLGVSTDTGCFRFANVTAGTHLVAAELIAAGADHTLIDRLMFETVSLGRLQVECRAKASIEYYFGGKCAVMYLRRRDLEGLDVDESELEGFANIPRSIAGVEVGVTVREQNDGSCRISLRSSDSVNASAVCEAFGGGGHARAAGCNIAGSPEEACGALLPVLAPCFPGVQA